MQGPAHFLGSHLEEDHEAHDLEAACSRADTAADKGQGKEDVLVEFRPGAVGGRRKAAGADEGQDLEKAVAQVIPAVVDAETPQMEGHEAARDDDDGQKGPPFGIAEKALEVAPFPALPVEEEIAAGQEHGYSSGRFQGQAVILRKIEERIAAAGGHGHEALIDGHAQRQSGQDIEDHGKDRNGQVDETGLAGRFLHAGHHGAEGYALMDGQGQAETAADLGHDRYQEEDEVEAAEPFHEAVPQQERLRQACPAVSQARRPSRRKSRDALKEGVDRRRESAGHDVGNHTQEAQEEPGRYHVPGPLPRSQVAFVMAAAVTAERRCKQGGGQGRGKIDQPRFPPPQGGQQRDEQRQAVDQGQAADEIKDDTAVHGLFPAFEVLHDFLGIFRLDEEDDPVAGHEDGLAVRDIGFAVADIGADQTFLGQADIHEALAGYGSPVLDDDFHGFGLGPFQEGDRDDAAAAGKGQDFAGRQEARRQDDIDADLFHEVAVFDARHADDGLLGTQVLGDEGQHEVQAVVIGQADDDVGIGNAFLFQEVDVRAVAADGQAVVQEFCHLAAAFAVFIENLDLDAFLVEHGGQKAAGPAGADDDDPFDHLRVAGDEVLTEFLDGLGVADEIRIVAREQAVIAMRDDHAVIAENHAGQDGRRHVHILKGDIDERRMTADLGFKEPDLAVGEVFDIEGGRRHEDAVDFTGRDHFRIEHEVDVEILLQIILGFRQELHVPDAGRRVLDAVFLGHDTGDHIDFIDSRTGDEDIGTADIGIVHGNRAGPVGQDGQYIEIILDDFQPFFIMIDDDDVELFIR